MSLFQERASLFPFRYSLFFILFPLFFLIILEGCSCKKKKDNPAELRTGCITSEATGLLLRLKENNLLIRQSNPKPVTTTLTITPVLEGGIPVPEGGEERYYLDQGADGSFESIFSRRSTEITRREPGRFALQVTAQRCDGEILSARTQLNILGTRPPILSVSFNPPFQSWLPLNVNLCAYLSAQDPDGGKEMELSVWFGEGERVVKRHDFSSTPEAQFCHVYARKGAYTFTAQVTDPQEDTTTYTRSLLIVLGVFPLGVLDFGQYVADLEVFGGGGSEPPFLFMAGGESGVLSYRVGPEGVHFLSRLEFKPDPAVEVRVDPVRRMGFVATGKAAGYFVDLTDPARIHLIYPNVFYPANARDAIALVDKVFLCQNGDWLVFRNRSLGLHFIEFRGEGFLAGIRDGSLAPRRENTPYFDFDPPLFTASGNVPYDNVLLEPNARGVACMVNPQGERWVAVSAGGALRLYKAPSPEPVTQISLPQAAPGIPARSEAVTGIARADGSLDLFVAMGEHGFAEYEVVTAPTLTVTLKKHLAVYLSGLFFGNTYDRILDLLYEPVSQRLSFVANSDLNLHTYMRWELSQWPPAFTGILRPYPYRNSKCDLNEVRGILNNGDTYSDLKNCLPSPEGFRFAGKTGGFQWIRSSRGGAGLEPSESSLQGGTYYTTSEIVLPETISWMTIPDTSHLWVGKGKKLEVYDLAPLEASLATGFQPPPQAELPVSIMVEGYAPVPGANWQGHHLLWNSSELLWVTVDAQGLPYPNGYAFCTACFLEVAATGDTSLAIVMARNLLTGGLQNFTLIPGSGIVTGSTSSGGGFKNLFFCGGEFFAQKEGDPSLYRVTTLSPVPWLAQNAAPEQRLYACYQKSKIAYLALDPVQATAELRIYPLVQNANPEWSFSIPYASYAPPQDVGLAGEGEILVAFLKGTGYGLVFFNPTLGDSPDALLGVDLDGNAGLYEKIGLFTVAGGKKRLLALSPTPMGPRQLVIKEIK